MKIFSFEIKKYRGKYELADECRRAYLQYKNKTWYEWLLSGTPGAEYRRNIPWQIVARSGRWLLIGSMSTYAKGCIKKPNYPCLDDVCDTKQYFCYRFISPSKLCDVYHTFPCSGRY